MLTQCICVAIYGAQNLAVFINPFKEVKSPLYKDESEIRDSTKFNSHGYTEGHTSHSRLCLKYIIYHIYMVHYKTKQFL